jgi:hypothetical protein
MFQILNLPMKGREYALFTVVPGLRASNSEVYTMFYFSDGCMFFRNLLTLRFDTKKGSENGVADRPSVLLKIHSSLAF